MRPAIRRQRRRPRAVRVDRGAHDGRRAVEVRRRARPEPRVREQPADRGPGVVRVERELAEDGRVTGGGPAGAEQAAADGGDQQRVGGRLAAVRPQVPHVPLARFGDGGDGVGQLVHQALERGIAEVDAQPDHPGEAVLDLVRHRGQVQHRRVGQRRQPQPGGDQSTCGSPGGTGSGGTGQVFAVAISSSRSTAPAAVCRVQAAPCRSVRRAAVENSARSSGLVGPVIAPSAVPVGVGSRCISGA